MVREDVVQWPDPESAMSPGAYGGAVCDYEKILCKHVDVAALAQERLA